MRETAGALRDAFPIQIVYIILYEKISGQIAQFDRLFFVINAFVKYEKKQNKKSRNVMI